ncbi:MAG: 2-oxoglutarate dehydrogenase complex dihydrolipoyllysine-residue succinyltransferase [Armatimonadetes bacterium]|nr:2-oxoglutarate dehydrogenase complex dihydrolipoyllysine-residue succinyltransferase [Armatimonadota bacterium]
MPIELVVPSVGESITEVQIGSWLKGQGERVDRDQPVVEIESDKATLELPAPTSGTITQVLKKTGEIAKVGDVIGYMEESQDSVVAPAKAPESQPQQPAVVEPKPATAQQQSPKSVQPAEPRVMPAAARLLAEGGLDASDVEGTGPGGRVLKEDVLRRAEVSSSPAQPSTERPDTLPATQTVSQPPGHPLQSIPAVAQEGREEDVVPMSPMRLRIAQRLVEAQQAAALLTTFNEVDMSQVMSLRKEHQEKFQSLYNVKLGFMSFFVKAVIEALKDVPQLNAEIRENSIVYRNYYDIGIAVGGGKGLVVPIIRSAERLSFAEIEVTIAGFAERAKHNKIGLEELKGGTFSISNGGVYGSLLSTPIVNPPQSGILGLHTIQERPVAREGQVVIRPMMYTALTYDHRIVDGKEAVGFLKRIKDCIENPARMLLEV